MGEEGQVTEQAGRPDPHPEDREGAPGRGHGWVLVNGRRHPLALQGNVLQLLSQLGIDSDTAGIAVAINDEVVPRTDWEMRTLAPGDQVEVVRAVQGG
jgi:sulfur carrier protein